MFFTAKKLYTLKVVSNIKPLFSKKFLRPSDKSNLLVSTVYNCAFSVADNIGDDFVKKSATEFLDSLQLDENGNLNSSMKTGDKMHKLCFNRHSKPSCSQNREEIVQSIKHDLTDIKQRILKNIKENIEDQCDENAFYYCWSGLDLEMKLSLQICINRLRDIFGRFCSEHIHVIQTFASPDHDQGEDPIVPDKSEDYETYLHYPPKTDCTKEELLKEMKTSWASTGKLWMGEKSKTTS